MDPDQTAPVSSLIRVHSVCFCDKSSLEGTLIYAADVISRQNNISRIRVRCCFDLILLYITLINEIKSKEVK